MLELKEVVVRGARVAFGGKKRCASSDLAEVLVSMATTDGGGVLGVRDTDRDVVGIKLANRERVERFVSEVADDDCEPPIEPRHHTEFRT